MRKYLIELNRTTLEDKVTNKYENYTDSWEIRKTWTEAKRGYSTRIKWLVKLRKSNMTFMRLIWRVNAWCNWNIQLFLYWNLDPWFKPYKNSRKKPRAAQIMQCICTTKYYEPKIGWWFLCVSTILNHNCGVTHQWTHEIS